MWKLCLTSVLVASASGLRGRGLIDFGRPPKETATAPQTCGPFPGQQVVLVTANKDFMPFFQNWLGYAGSFLTSFEQVVVIAEDAEIVPMLRHFLHNGARTPFKIAIPVNKSFEEVTAVADRHHSSDIYEISVPISDPYFSESYKKLVSQRPREILHFLSQNCTVLYADVDTAWLRNPFDAIRRAGDYEIYVTDDSPKPSKGLESDYLCSCFLYMHPTSNVKSLIGRWADYLGGKGHHNQRYLNQAFHQFRKRRPHETRERALGFAVALPREEFPPGCAHYSNPTVLHANYIMGETKKKEFLKAHGGWSLD